MHLLDFGAETDRGTTRAINEDSILASPPVFVVADGVGGSEGGEVASALVVEEFGRLATLPVIDADAVRATLTSAHRRVRELHARQLHGASSTAVGVVGVMSGDEPYWVVFNIGDSRVYRLPTRNAPDDRPGLTQISVDHSHVQELVDAGVITADEAETHPERNLVTRAVGADEVAEPDFWMIPMVPGDRWLICSDGLLADLPYAAVRDRVEQRTPAAETARDLIGMALQAGVTDNVSVIVIDVIGDGLASAAQEATAVQPHLEA
ncbi:PP2C family serine/threonine-protein phosphatase [Microlunatus sp. Gsoil 973]|uniref:PP2C family protein-serine/threonine phosphatase n=1 Tax=Microlunatus sp. Gsoil 973 TaxID=2672569 RepID=UPI0018A82BA3|nr:PP2C family serine/threonine-protein phosphatase [Microlunatus sp. Gsoil 973]